MKPSLIVIGLGNPGKQYERTRHNVGFRAIDALAEAFGESDERAMGRFLAVGSDARIGTAAVLLLKPQTFMNLSVNCVQKVVDYYKLDPKENILLLCDDIDLPLGETRLRTAGGPGTHNGLRSVHAVYGENFPRLRIGLGAPDHGEDLANWVLSIPSEEEEKALSKAISGVPDLVKDYVLGS